jgi:hypothetical protein
MDRKYSAKNLRHLIWKDPSLSIRWPSEPPVISKQAIAWPNFNEFDSKSFDMNISISDTIKLMTLDWILISLTMRDGAV